MPGHRLIAMVLLLIAAATRAQPTGLQLGAMSFFPTLGVSVGYDDNIALSPDAPVSSLYYRFSPAVRMLTSTRRSTLQLEAGAEIARFLDSPADDFEDYGLDGLWSWEPTIRQDFGLAASFRRGHNRRGEGLQEFVPPDATAEVDRFERRDVDLRYGFGADTARGRIGVSAGFSRLRYLNNRELTAIGDYSSERLGASFDWRVAPKTTLSLLARAADFRYEEGSRDNADRFLGAGAEWLATARTSGRVELGYREKRFDQGTGDFSGLSWLASLDWRPREYSVFELSTARIPDAAFGDGQFIVRDSLELAWRHQWRARLGTTLDLGIGDERIRPEGRSDDLLRVGASLSYRFRPGLLLGAGIQRHERSSSDARFDYVRNELILSAELQF